MPSFKLPPTWTKQIPARLWKLLELRMQSEIPEYPNVAILRAKRLEGHPGGKIARVAIQRKDGTTMVYSLWSHGSEWMHLEGKEESIAVAKWVIVQPMPSENQPPVFRTPHTYQAAGYCKIAEAGGQVLYWLWCCAEDGREAVLPITVDAALDLTRLRMHFVRSAMAAPKEQFTECNGVLNAEKLQATGPFNYVANDGRQLELFAVNGEIVQGRWSAFMVIGAVDLGIALKPIQWLQTHYRSDGAVVLRLPGLTVIPLHDVLGGALTCIENFQLVS